MRSRRTEAPKAEDADGTAPGDAPDETAEAALGSLLHPAIAKNTKAMETKDFMRFSING